MFTVAMTNAELQHEAYLDFLELKGPIRIAFGNFRWQMNSSGKRILIVSIILFKRKLIVPNEIIHGK